jgi:S1-C subfamily serine protease
MRRQALYSSRRSSAPAQANSAADRAGAGARSGSSDKTPETPSAPARAKRLRKPSPTEWLWLTVLLLAGLLMGSLALQLGPGQRRLTQEDIDAAVLKTLSTQNLPSEYAKAYENIRPSVVRVVGYVRADRIKPVPPSKPAAGNTPSAKPPKAAASAPAGNEEVELGVGTGVVIVDKGIILTNLHVVSGADRIEVTFQDGLVASAYVRSVQAENDLAVLQADKIPDDLIAATMRSTRDLAPGDKVLAVGFPFGIGPSASGGVVSGLGRVFRSPEGQQDMRNLIQFDAAANPGNSGGPLVTMDGEVVGIVTAILNPTSARTFLGIGFAVPIENAASAVGIPPF